MTRLMTAGILLLTALAGCGGPAAPSQEPATTTSSSTSSPAAEPNVLLLTATGDATIDSFVYVIDGEQTEEQSVQLPWTKTVNIPSDGKKHEWKLTVQHREGSLAVVAQVNGRLVTRGGGGGTGKSTATLSGSINP